MFFVAFNFFVLRTKLIFYLIIDLYDINKSSYNVETFTNDEIIAKGIVITRGSGTENKANVNIVINKNNDNWQITKYDIQELK